MTGPSELGPWWLPLWAEFTAGNTFGLDAPRLSVGAMLLAAHGSHHLNTFEDIHRELNALTAWVQHGALGADRVQGSPSVPPTIAFWNHVCTDVLGVRGDQERYHDPRNSFLPDIRRRRLGLPIGLALVWLHAAPLLGVKAFGVGMPGHFLVGAAANETTVYIDCFHQGQILDSADAAALYARLFDGRPHPPFDPSFLAPVPDDAMFVRMTANLKQHAARVRDLTTLTDLARLRWFLPLPSLDEGRELVRLCVAVGAAAEAAHWLDQVESRFAGVYPAAQRAHDRTAVRAALS
jgi:regulator of sirC expression with transglutaminase-like and TPR domain